MSSLAGKSLIVFDANAETVVMLEAWFETLGVAAHGHTSELSVANVTALVEQKQPDVIIFDVALPYDEQVRTLQELQRAGAFGTTPVIVTTTNTRVVSALARGLDLQIRHLVEKPYDMDALMQRVASALSAPSARPGNSGQHEGRRPQRTAAARPDVKPFLIDGPQEETTRSEETECHGTGTDCYIASALRREFQSRRDRWQQRTGLRLLWA